VEVVAATGAEVEVKVTEVEVMEVGVPDVKGRLHAMIRKGSNPVRKDLHHRLKMFLRLHLKKLKLM
jgi:hypothetical protein